MTTHSADFDAGKAGLTLTVELFALGSDTVAYTAGTVTEQTNRLGVYRAAFTTVAAGIYELRARVTTTPKAAYLVVFAGTDAEVVTPIETATNIAGAALATATAVAAIPAATRDIANGDGDAAVGSWGETTYQAMIVAAEASGYAQNIIAKLGAFAGSGVNTVLGFLKAIMSKTASTPSDVGGTFEASTDSLEAQADAGSGLTDQNITDIATETAAAVAPLIGGVSGETNNNPIADGGKLHLRLGDDYLTADGRQRAFTVNGIPADWSTGTGSLRLRSKGTTATDISAVDLSYSGGTLTASFDVASTAFEDLKATEQGEWCVTVVPTTGGTISPIKGVLVIEAAIPAAA